MSKFVFQRVDRRIDMSLAFSCGHFGAGGTMGKWLTVLAVFWVICLFSDWMFSK